MPVEKTRNLHHLQVLESSKVALELARSGDFAGAVKKFRDPYGIDLYFRHDEQDIAENILMTAVIASKADKANKDVAELLYCIKFYIRTCRTPFPFWFSGIMGVPANLLEIMCEFTRADLTIVGLDKMDWDSLYELSTKVTVCMSDYLNLFADSEEKLALLDDIEELPHSRVAGDTAPVEGFVIKPEVGKIILDRWLPTCAKSLQVKLEHYPGLDKKIEKHFYELSVTLENESQLELKDRVAAILSRTLLGQQPDESFLIRDMPDLPIQQIYNGFSRVVHSSREYAPVLYLTADKKPDPFLFSLRGFVCHSVKRITRVVEGQGVDGLTRKVELENPSWENPLRDFMRQIVVQIETSQTVYMHPEKWASVLFSDFTKPMKDAWLLYQFTLEQLIEDRNKESDFMATRLSKVVAAASRYGKMIVQSEDGKRDLAEAAPDHIKDLDKNRKRDRGQVDLTDSLIRMSEESLLEAQRHFIDKSELVMDARKIT